MTGATYLIIFKCEGCDAIEKVVYFKGTWDEMKAFVDEYRKKIQKTLFRPALEKQIFATIIENGTIQTFTKRVPLTTFEAAYVEVVA